MTPLNLTGTGTGSPGCSEGSPSPPQPSRALRVTALPHCFSSTALAHHGELSEDASLDGGQRPFCVFSRGSGLALGIRNQAMGRLFLIVPMCRVDQRAELY